MSPIGSKDIKEPTRNFEDVLARFKHIHHTLTMNVCWILPLEIIDNNLKMSFFHGQVPKCSQSGQSFFNWKKFLRNFFLLRSYKIVEVEIALSFKFARSIRWGDLWGPNDSIFGKIFYDAEDEGVEDIFCKMCARTSNVNKLVTRNQTTHRTFSQKHFCTFLDNTGLHSGLGTIV